MLKNMLFSRNPRHPLLSKRRFLPDLALAPHRPEGLFIHRYVTGVVHQPPFRFLQALDRGGVIVEVHMNSGADVR